MFGEVESPVLEFKFKSGAVGRKLSFLLKPFNLNLNFNIDILKGIFERSELPAWALYDILPLEPPFIKQLHTKIFPVV